MPLSASMTSVDPFAMDAALAAVAPHVGSWHVDVMDGCFAPAFGFGPTMVTALVARGTRPVDVHLMIDRPDVWALRFAVLGVRSIAFHLETDVDACALACEIRRHGVEAFIALRPDTPVAAARPIFDSVDGCLLLTAPAGGGAFDAAALRKAFDVPEHLLTVVDGRIDTEHFAALAAADITDVVIGQALFDHPDPGRRGAELACGLAEAWRTRVARRRCTARLGHGR